MKVIGYVRVSTEEQAASGAGLAAQRATLTAEAERRGWDLRIIEDAGQSAKTIDRPGLREALDLVAAGEVDGLVVAKLDRLARSVIDFANLMQWFDEARASLIVLDLAVDTSTASGRLVANVFSAVASWEREVIGERTSAALQSRKAEGRPVSGPAVANELRGRIAAMRELGQSFAAIAEALNAEQVPTARGGAQWHASTVRSALGLPRAAKAPRSADLPAIKSRRKRTR